MEAILFLIALIVIVSWIITKNNKRGYYSSGSTLFPEFSAPQNNTGTSEVIFQGVDVMGIYYRGTYAMDYIESLEDKTPKELSLIPVYLLVDKFNEYDRNAVKVISESGIHLGYVQKEYSQQVAKAIEKHIYLEATFVEIHDHCSATIDIHRHMLSTTLQAYEKRAAAQNLL